MAIPSEASLDRLFPAMPEASRILAACIPADYTASRIAHAVEDADAQLLNLNVTTDGVRLDNRVVFELRVNHRSPLSVSRSLERYGFEVLDVDAPKPAEDGGDDMMNSRLAELIHYLHI